MAEGRLFEGTDPCMSNIPDLIKSEVKSLTEEYRTKRVRHSLPEEYDFNHKFRGLAVVISNGKFQLEGLGKRDYSRKEIFLMSNAFKRLGFMVLKFENLTAKQIQKVLENVAALKTIHQDSDAFACAVGSHGNELLAEKVKETDLTTKKYGHVIYGTDTYISTADIVGIFADTSCKELKAKPRLFFIQACRCRADSSSNRYDQGAMIQTHSNVPVNHPHPRDSKEDKSETHDDKTKDLGSIKNNAEVNIGEIPTSDDDQTEGVFGFLKGVFRKYVFNYPPKDLVSTVKVPCQNHFLIAYATAPGKLSLGRDALGGWLFLGVAKFVEFHVTRPQPTSSFTLDLLSMLTEVAGAISIQMESNTGIKETTGLKTAVCFEHRLLKDAVF